MAPGVVAQLAATIFSYMSDLPRLARMQTCHVEEGVVTRPSPAEALAAPWDSSHADRLSPGKEEHIVKPASRTQGAK